MTPAAVKLATRGIRVRIRPLAWRASRMALPHHARSGRTHITWQNDSTLKLDTDAGTQTRLFRFGPPPAAKGRAQLAR